jgi:hypothetical protein
MDDPADVEMLQARQDSHDLVDRHIERRRLTAMLPEPALERPVRGAFTDDDDLSVVDVHLENGKDVGVAPGAHPHLGLLPHGVQVDAGL